MTNKTELPRVDSYARAMAMIEHPDCEIDLDGMDSYERAWVMANRPDCPRGMK